MTFPNSITFEGRIYVPKSASVSLPPGKFARILQDDEAKDGLQRIGMPAVFPLHLARYCSLTESWQRYWFALLIHAYTGWTHYDPARLTRTELEQLRGKWRSLTKSSEAFTNFKGTNEYRDYITPNNLPGLPGQEPLTCCGNVVKVLGEPVRLAGEWKTPIETLRGDVPPPPIEKINYLTAPHLIFLATNVAADKSAGAGRWKPIVLPDGRYRVDPFPQLPNVPVPLRTHGREAETYQRDGMSCAVNYIKTSRLEAVTVLASPYVP